MSLLCRWPGWLLLAGAERDYRLARPERFARAWVGLLIGQLLWGLAMIGLWNLTRLLLGYRNETYLLSGVIVMAAILLGPMRRGSVALIEQLAGGHPTARMLLAGTLLLVLASALSALRSDWHYQEVRLAAAVGWLRPPSKADRVLLLMPLWGAWTMLILPQFCRSRLAEPRLTALAAGAGPLLGTGLMGVLLAVTIGYFAFLPWTQLTIPASCIAAGLGGGLALARRRGSVDRDTLAAANLLAQLALLVSYLANRDIRFW
jgi:hypothetical protein